MPGSAVGFSVPGRLLPPHAGAGSPRSRAAACRVTPVVPPQSARSSLLTLIFYSPLLQKLQKLFRTIYAESIHRYLRDSRPRTTNLSIALSILTSSSDRASSADMACRRADDSACTAAISVLVAVDDSAVVCKASPRLLASAFSSAPGIRKILIALLLFNCVSEM